MEPETTATMDASPFSVMDVAKAKTALRLRAPIFAARVAPFYALLQWEWVRDGTLNERFIPREKDILRSLVRLIDHMEPREDACMSISSGGLTVYATRNFSGQIECHFDFQVDDDFEA